MSAAAKVITVIVVLGAIFVSIFLVVYFALLGLVFIPLVAGLAYLLVRGLVATAKDGKDAVSNNNSPGS